MVTRFSFLPLIIVLISMVATPLPSAFANGDADTSTGILNPRFRTLKVSVADNFMFPPVIRLGSSDRIIFSFDELAEQNSWLQYRLIHCNADWQPSRLAESEYLDGFNIADLEDFAYSQNTFIHFVNYRIEFPNEQMRILASGNYLLQVFPRDDPDDIIIQARFMVTEQAVPLSGSVTTRTDRGFNTEWQQLEIMASTENLRQANPFGDFTLTLCQNGVPSSNRSLQQPSATGENTLIFRHSTDLIFPAGNEYRRFESVSTGFPGMGADSVKNLDGGYHVWLKPDSERASRNYEFDRTQHGRFLVREYNATDSDLGADYVTVHFELRMPRLPNADIYVDGEMTNGRFSDANRMVYDPGSRTYRLEMPLKQGAYNYRYVTLPASGNPLPSTEITEGDKYETGNEYWAAIYYHPPGARADRLVGFTVLEN